MKSTIRNDCAHAYVGIVAVVTIFMVLFAAAMHGQELPNAPQAADKHQIPPVDKQRPLLAKPGNPDLERADRFRERGHFKLPRIMSVLTHIDWDLSYDKPKGAGHGNHKSK